MGSQKYKGIIPKPIIRFGLRHEALILFFLLPFSFLHRMYRKMSELFISLFRPKSSEETHQMKRIWVQEQVRKWQESGMNKKMCTGRDKTHSLMLRLPGYRDTLHKIQVGHLNEIVNLDVERRVVKVEPLVSTSQLSAYLTPLGWTIPVVPELGSLTVGGLVMGGGLETSSLKYGLFHKTCRSYEVVLSSGEVVTCSQTENEELFRGVPVSYGSLGFLTAVEIEIIEAPRYVRMEYHPVYNLETALSLIQQHGNDPDRNDFVESLGFAKNRWVIMTGKMASGVEEGKVNEISWWYKPWFHKHVESFLTKGPGYDYLPLRDYYHRYDRSFGWGMQSYIPYGNHPLFRFFFGWIMPVETVFLKTLLPNEYFTRSQFIQDFLVKAEAMEEIILESDRLTKLYPVWICPFKLHPADGSICTSRTEKEEIYYDIGVYGKPTVKGFNAKAATRKMEEVLLRHNGYQAMYTDTYMTPEEIRSTLDFSLLDKLREVCDAEKAFPDLISKTSVKGRSEGL